MKVSRKMINKDIRLTGSIIRSIYKFREESQFRTCNKMLNKFMKGKYPKDLKVDEQYRSREV